MTACEVGVKEVDERSWVDREIEVKRGSKLSWSHALLRVEPEHRAAENSAKSTATTVRYVYQ